MEKLLSVLITQWNYSLEKYHKNTNRIAKKVLKLVLHVVKYLRHMNSLQEFFRKEETEERRALISRDCYMLSIILQ